MIHLTEFLSPEKRPSQAGTSLPLTNFLGVFYAIVSATAWGSGDFSGGLAARKSHRYQVLMLAALSGMVLLIACALLWGESIPSLKSMFWAALAGAAGALGMAALYHALSLGHTASVAPTSALTCAISPVLFGILTAGFPKYTQLGGFGLAFLGIWLVSKSPRAGETSFKEGMFIAFLSGIGFGGFFIFIAQVDRSQLFAPVFIARTVTFLIALLMLQLKHIPTPRLISNPIALLAGILDTGGNIFYLLATQYTRLDVAAVLSSMYPAGTVILATIILKERVSIAQWAGAALCLMAIGLITI